MKRYAMVMALVIACWSLLNAAGIVVNRNITQLACTRLMECSYEANIQNQVAIVTVTEIFQNTLTTNVNARYYYPLPEGASATQLRWFVDNQWYTALIAGTPQNPGGGPSNLPQYFIDYVGAFPVIFDFDAWLWPEETLIVELTYVQLC